MIRVGILRGGTGHGYDDSLASGAFALDHIPRDRYEPMDIFIDRDGMWHLGGVPVSPERLRHRIDVAWNSLNGFYGEDGKVQRVLESLGIPYVGSDPFASFAATHKKYLKDSLASLGVRTPEGVYVEEWGDGDREATVAAVASHVAQKFSPPWHVEAISRGHGNGPITARTRDELMAVLFAMHDASVPVLVEEAVLGTEVHVVSMPEFRNQPQYTFPAFVPKSASTKLAPGQSTEIEQLAATVHRGLGLGAFSRTQIVRTPRGTLYVTGVETVPHLHAGHRLAEILQSTGVSLGEFTTHLLDRVRN